jgi:hypothetical protein
VCKSKNILTFPVLGLGFNFPKKKEMEDFFVSEPTNTLKWPTSHSLYPLLCGKKVEESYSSGTLCKLMGVNVCMYEV